ncbi:hypothetical protein OCK02_18085 [Rhizobium sp. TRM96647]|uniref:hypothetical protein n=1 Tax=unclassified Rhizobium TaxID=2613769 RepID=UPI0021E704B9|nr:MULTISPECIES: hypothetical protein [unclassified Rhizobium]MCV3738118.1 hypothetical protein [Rhizobium sp. TRM96647]MCV3759805.1 hypothetical protein [Rhizobium sp. TRM96650]
MSKLQQIEASVAELDKDEFEAFSVWFEKLHAERWDQQFARDVLTGSKLDQLADDALRDHRAGRTSRL